MSVILPIVLLVIFLAILACLYTEGMWGNAIHFINVVTAALLATNFYEPTADKLESMWDWFASATYLIDYLTLWILFTLFFVIFRLATDSISKVKVRFLKLADQIGSVLFACLVGWVFMSFTLFSMHTAPLSKKFIWEGFDADKKMLFNFAAPDRVWIYFVRSVSKHAYARSPEQPFDSDDQFRANYEDRRMEIEDYVTKKKAYLISDKDKDKDKK